MERSQLCEHLSARRFGEAAPDVLAGGVAGGRRGEQDEKLCGYFLPGQQDSWERM